MKNTLQKTYHTLIMRLSIVVLLFSLANALSCVSECEKICKEANCLAACSSSCGSTVYTSDPYLQSHSVGTLHNDGPVTGSDAPWPMGNFMYFTTLKGRVYQIDTRSNKLRVVHDIAGGMVYREQGCGLYDIAFDPDFLHNNVVFLYYAMTPMDNENHWYNAIVEYQMEHGKLKYKRHVYRSPQTLPASHNFMRMGARQHVLRNSAELVTSNQFENGDSSGSLKYQIRKNNTFSVPIVFASGIGQVISCDASLYRSNRVMCVVDRPERDHYTLEEYTKHRSYHQCATEDCTSTKLHFNITCPVSSVAVVSTRDFCEEFATVYLHTDSCYRDGAFQPAQLVRMYREHGVAWRLFADTMAPENSKPRMFINTSLIYADKYTKLYVAGYSLRTSAYEVEEIAALKSIT